MEEFYVILNFLLKLQCIFAKIPLVSPCPLVHKKRLNRGPLLLFPFLGICHFETEVFSTFGERNPQKPRSLGTAPLTGLDYFSSISSFVVLGTFGERNPRNPQSLATASLTGLDHFSCISSCVVLSTFGERNPRNPRSLATAWLTGLDYFSPNSLCVWFSARSVNAILASLESRPSIAQTPLTGLN